jgi:hypothetical protein
MGAKHEQLFDPARKRVDPKDLLAARAFVVLAKSLGGGEDLQVEQPKTSESRMVVRFYPQT